MQKTFQALFTPEYCKVLQLLQESDMHAGELADHLVSSKRDLLHHLSIPHEADLIQETNKGGAITYQLDVTGLEETYCR